MQHFFNLNAINLNVHFLSTFNSELGCRFIRTIQCIPGSAQSTILNRDILRPYESGEQSRVQQNNIFILEMDNLVKYETQTALKISPSQQNKQRPNF